MPNVNFLHIRSSGPIQCDVIALFKPGIFFFQIPLVLVLLVLFSHSPDLSATDSSYQIEIIKSAQELRLKRGNHVIKTFRIAYGRGDSGRKKQRGDNKTPVGTYKIMEFKANSKFHFFMQLNYPNLLDAWHGYRNQIITPGEYKQIAISFKNQEMPPQNTALGGYIGIHGLGEITSNKLKIHQSLNWTEGCIALSNVEIDILRKYISMGAIVVIKE